MIKYTALLAAPLVLLAACSGETQPQPEETAAAGTVEESGLAISDGRMVMPAVSGNPGVVYFDARNTGDAPVTLVAIDVAGAGRSEMHTMAMADGAMSMEKIADHEIAAGQTAEFRPGGLHVMVFDLDPGLGAGGETEVTLMLSNGDKASVTVPIQSAGEAR